MDDEDETGEAAATRRWLAMLARESAAGDPNWATASPMNLDNVYDNVLGDPFSEQHKNQQRFSDQAMRSPSFIGADVGGYGGYGSADASSTWSLLIAALFYKSDTFDTNWMNVFLAAAIIVLFSATVIGNSFVIVAILIERNLRTIGNYLVLSLAIADLLVALLVMPMAGIYQILDRWTLGVFYCEIWTSADVFCCTASILHLLAIALDRYWAVTRVDYIRCQRNEKRILFMIFFVWMAACIISMAPVFGWKDDQFEWRITNDMECLISQDIGYQIFATCTTFYFPLILTLIFYWKIYQVARKRIRRKTGNRIKISLQHPSSSSSTSTPCSRQLQRNAAGSAHHKQQHPSTTISTSTSRSLVAECRSSPPTPNQQQPTDTAGADGSQQFAASEMMLATDAQLETDKKRHPTREKQINVGVFPYHGTSDGCSPSATTCRCSCHIQQQQRRRNTKPDVAARSPLNCTRHKCSLQFASTDPSLAALNELANANPKQPSEQEAKPASIADSLPLDASESAVLATVGRQDGGRRCSDSKTAVGDNPNQSSNAPAGELCDALGDAAERQGSLSTETSITQPMANQANAMISGDQQPTRSGRSNLNDEPLLNGNHGPLAMLNGSAGQPNLNAEAAFVEGRPMVQGSLSTGEQDNRILGITGSDSTLKGPSGDNIKPSAGKRQSIREEAIQTEGPRSLVLELGAPDERMAPAESNQTDAVYVSGYYIHQSNGSPPSANEMSTAERRDSCAQCKGHLSLIGEATQFGCEPIRSRADDDEPRSSTDSSDDQRSADCALDRGSLFGGVPNDSSNESAKHQRQGSALESQCDQCCNNTNPPKRATSGLRQITGDDNPKESCALLTSDRRVLSELLAAPSDNYSKQTGGFRLNGSSTGSEITGARKSVHFLVRLQNTPIALYWLQLRSQFTKGASHHKSAQNFVAPEANSTTTILVDKTGHSSLVNVCKLCQCTVATNGATGQYWNAHVDESSPEVRRLEENDDEIYEDGEPVVIIDKPTGAMQQAVVQDNQDLERSDRGRASGMVIAASTANIAVSTVGPPQSAAAVNSVQTQQAAEGIESKRERKAAKTLSIITGVFVICWLPFFVMAILMPMLNIKPHKFVFALLLWLGYFNSMLNPIIYTIFSPDFRKAFKRLLCGRLATCWRRRMQQQEMVAEMAANKQRANHILSDQDQLEQTGCLGQMRHCLLYINPVISHCCQPKVYRSKKAAAPLIISGGGGSTSGWSKRAV